MGGAARLLAAVLFLLAAATGVASAHDVKLASTRIAVDGTRVVVDIGVNGTDVSRVAGESVMNRLTETVDPGLFAPHEGRLLSIVRATSGVGSGAGAACAERGVEVAVDSDGGVLVTRTFDCAGVAGRLWYRSRLMPTITPDGREAVRLADGTGSRDLGLLDARHEQVAITDATPPGTLEVATGYLLLGIEHIFLGFDHICFVLAILLWARRAGPLVGVVTAFTAAHSITLALSVLGLASLPSWFVEPAIAVTIVVAALENLWNRQVEKRWIGTFFLGLVHGFGFAGVLTELGLPTGSVAVALAGFNLGVEVGQIAIVLCAVPLLRFADARIAAARGGAVERRAALVVPASLAIAALGIYWVLERTLLA